ncbi:MAG: hypothetical protein E6J03_09795, partial [Chloroflexi bacterium]
MYPVARSSQDIVTRSQGACRRADDTDASLERFPAVPSPAVLGVMVRRIREPARPCTRRRREAGGQSLVEFAISLPVLLLLLAVAYVGWQAVHRHRPQRRRPRRCGHRGQRRAQGRRLLEPGGHRRHHRGERRAALDRLQHGRLRDHVRLVVRGPPPRAGGEPDQRRDGGGHGAVE